MNQINNFTEQDIIDSVRVYVCCDYNRPEMVYFVWHDVDSMHKKWECFNFITNWLEENNLWFTVSTFQHNQCEIFVHSQEARTMLKLMFQPLIDYQISV